MEVGQNSGGYFIVEHYYQNRDSLDFSDAIFPKVNLCNVWCGRDLRRLSYFRKEYLQRKRYKNGSSVEHIVGVLLKN